MPEHNLPEHYFEFTCGRIGFALGSPWEIVSFADNSLWHRIGFGFYWKGDHSHD